MIGQVLEGVQPLPDDSRILALTEAMTAFMEAWMEHILKQKIKFRLVNMWWSSGLTVAVHVPFLWRFSTAWYGTVRHGSVRYGTAQFGSVCVSTAV